MPTLFGTMPGCGHHDDKAHEFTNIGMVMFPPRLRLCQRCGVIEASWGEGKDRRTAYYVPLAVTVPEVE